MTPLNPNKVKERADRFKANHPDYFKNYMRNKRSKTKRDLIKKATKIIFNEE